MAIILDGTTGITTPAEAVAGNLSYTGTLTGGTGVVNIGSGQVYKDASGNVGIGVTPSAWYPTYRALSLGYSSNGMFSGGNDQLGLTQNAYLDSGVTWRYTTTNPTSQYTQTSGVHVWRSAASGTAGAAISFTESMRIDSSGNLLVGTTSQIGIGLLNVKRATAANCVSLQNGSDAGYGVTFYNVAGAVAGSISWTATTTTYSTSSDYRLKNTIAPMTGALAKVALLKPVTYKWNVDGSDGQGFIAHELDEVVPGCVTGEKDAVETYTDEDGNEATRPVYQGIDTSFLVATLTAAIQELKAIVDAQGAEIAALKGAAA